LRGINIPVTLSQGNKNLIEAAARAKVKRFVLLSITSCEQVGQMLRSICLSLRKSWQILLARLLAASCGKSEIRAGKSEIRTGKSEIRAG
jgi:acyl-CoA reductase-like NAD-dependent aldehyde dehydrogenase